MTEHNEPRWRGPLASGFLSVPKSEETQANALGWYVIGPVYGTVRVVYYLPSNPGKPRYKA